MSLFKILEWINIIFIPQAEVKSNPLSLRGRSPFFQFDFLMAFDNIYEYLSRISMRLFIVFTKLFIEYYGRTTYILIFDKVLFKNWGEINVLIHFL